MTVADLDRSPALLRLGYRFLTEERRRHGDAEVFAIRLLGMRATVLVGPDGARTFYDEGRLRRSDAMPEPIRHTLFGDGGVQTLDDEHHRHRKAMFREAVTPDSVRDLSERSDDGWTATTDRWCERRGPITVFEEAKEVLCRSAVEWAGAEVPDDDLPALADDLTTRVAGFGSPGPAHLRARRARLRTEGWAEEQVERARAHGPDDTALGVVASHRDVDGELLPPDVAAVELINLIRPTTAIAWYVTFAALVLHRHPSWRVRLRDASPEVRRAFVHEVRRSTPFAPFLGARARTPFEHLGHPVDEGELVLLDVHGSNHLTSTWGDPDAFRPERFLDREPGPFDLIPQGGGHEETGHRCAGEEVTVTQIERAVDALGDLDWSVPRQDLRVPLRRMPTLPRSGMVLDDIRRAA